MNIVEKEFKRFVEELKAEKFYIAYSGGVDSQVLLHLSSKYLSGKIVALHVNHGISKNAFFWEDFCKKEAKKHNAEIRVAHFKLKDEKANLEEKARVLRHGFFEENVMQNEMLMTGHHLDDQAETFMLRLMRGSGVDGLSSMAEKRQMKSGGYLVRPLLNVSKEQILEYAKQEKLSWVEDESNQSSDYDRNFIRNEVMPLLKTRWHKANASIANSAKHCAQVKLEQEVFDEKDYENIVFENKVNTNALKEVKKTKQQRLLRLWLKKNDKQMLDTKALNVLIDEVAFSREDSASCYKGKDYEIRKSFGFLYLFNPNEMPTFVAPEGSKESKENLKMFFKGRMRSKKDVLKTMKVPYWERSFYPTFVNDQNEVVAIGNILSQKK